MYWAWCGRLWTEFDFHVLHSRSQLSSGRLCMGLHFKCFTCYTHWSSLYLQCSTREMLILFMMLWSSVDAVRLHCWRTRSELSCGRLCTEFDSNNAHLIHDVLVVCGCSSTSLFMCEFSHIMRSSLYGARIYCFRRYMHWSSLYGARQYEHIAHSSWFGRLWMQLDLFVHVRVLRYRVGVSV